MFVFVDASSDSCGGAMVDVIEDTITCRGTLLLVPD